MLDCRDSWAWWWKLMHVCVRLTCRRPGERKQQYPLSAKSPVLQIQRKTSAFVALEFAHGTTDRALNPQWRACNGMHPAAAPDARRTAEAPQSSLRMRLPVMQGVVRGVPSLGTGGTSGDTGLCRKKVCAMETGDIKRATLSKTALKQAAWFYYAPSYNVCGKSWLN